MTSLRSITLWALTLGASACDLGSTLEFIPANEHAQQLGIDAYAFQSDDDTLDILLFNAAYHDVGTITVVNGPSATDVSVSLADSEHTLDLHITDNATRVEIDEQSSTPYPLVEHHLHVLTTVVDDDAVVEQLGGPLSWHGPPRTLPSM